MFEGGIFIALTKTKEIGLVVESLAYLNTFNTYGSRGTMETAAN